MTTQKDWDRLADTVTRRRDYLGLTQEQVAGKPGAPSTATLRNIENGTGTSYRAKTLWGLDAALLWKRGTAQYLVEPLDVMDSAVRDDIHVEELIFSTKYAERTGADFLVGDASTAPAPPSGEPSPLGDYSDDELLVELARRLKTRTEDGGRG